MRPEEILGLLAGLFQVLAYLDYNSHITSGKTSPNGATWAVWASITILNTGSYFSMTGKWFLIVLPVVNSIFCIWTFFFALKLGKFRKLDAWDRTALLVGILAALVWIIFKSATSANLILQVAILCGFIPTYRSVGRNPDAEMFRPWFLWGSAYVFLTATVLISWKGQWTDLVYPICGMTLHCFVPGIATVSYLFLPEEEEED